MPREKGVTQLEVLRRKQAEIAEQLRAAELREKERQKARDARRRELLATITANILRDAPQSELAQLLFRELGEKLTRPADRALFPGLSAPADAATTQKSLADAAG